MANNVYAHIVDISPTTRGIKNLLSKDEFIFEVHYLEYDIIFNVT